MNNRRGLEFKKSVKVTIFIRAGGPEKLCCEGCGLTLMGKPFDYHHNPAIWTWTEEKRQRVIKEGLTADDGELLGKCCHDGETAKDCSDRAHGERIVAKSAKAKARKGPPLLGTKASGLRKRMNGTVERW